jgi:hypothetical protein
MMTKNPHLIHPFINLGGDHIIINSQTTPRKTPQTTPRKTPQTTPRKNQELGGKDEAPKNNYTAVI